MNVTAPIDDEVPMVSQRLSVRGLDDSATPAGPVGMITRVIF